jgi:uncharacterized protein YndB with AHSA1/START domain
MNAQEKIIEYEFTVDASPSEVYNAWSTAEGIKTFFAPDGNVNLKKFGDYHIYFFPDMQPGSRGAEDERVISFEEDKMISHTWGFPPAFPDLRANQKTVVNVRFIPVGDGKTKVHFIQSGWGHSEEWQKSYDYFVNAWGNVVLARLQYRFAVGPVDWNNQPDLSKYYLVK